MILHLFNVLKIPRNSSQGLDKACDDNRGTSNAVFKQELLGIKGAAVASFHLKVKSLDMTSAVHGKQNCVVPKKRAQCQGRLSGLIPHSLKHVAILWLSQSPLPLEFPMTFRAQGYL